MSHKDVINFRKYLHVERLSNLAVSGILNGTCYVFPKLDGTNASVWRAEDGCICAGSRNRELSEEKDNAGFYKNIVNNVDIINYLCDNPTHILYGEWLVPHTLKGYKEDAWRNFYIFDVYDTDTNLFIPFESYVVVGRDYNLNMIYPITALVNPNKGQLQELVDNNTFLMQEGCIGEGVVIKNYDYINKFGDFTYAKLLSNTFNVEKVKKGNPQPPKFNEAEKKLVDKYVDYHLVSKVYNKIIVAEDGWSSKFISRLFESVYKDLIEEELYTAITKMKKPTIDFKEMFTLVVGKVKELMKEELF